MAVNLIQGLAGLAFVCCILPIVLILIIVLVIWPSIKRANFDKNTKLLLTIGTLILFISLPIAGFGLIGELNRTNNDHINIEPSDKWELSSHMKTGHIIEVRFTSDKPLKEVCIAKVIDEVFDCSTYTTSESLSTLKIVAQNSDEGSTSFMVESDGDYKVIFYNNNQSDIDLDLFVKFRNHDNEIIMYSGLIVGITGVILILIAVYRRKKIPKPKFNNIQNYQII
jgi:hypothetical protein